jgi:hypothetical protein
MAPLSMSQLIDKTIAYLNGPSTNRPKLATLDAIALTGTTINSMTVTPADGTNTHKGPAILEVEGGCLVYASSWDANSGTVTVPSWGNGFEGAPPATGSSDWNDMVTVNPLWPRYFVGQHIIDAIGTMYPRLYGVKTTQLTSTTLDERYLVPADCEEILSLKIEGFGTTAPRRVIRRRSLQTVNGDGNRYLSINPIGIPGRPMYLVYKARPVLPTDPRDLTWTWTTSGLPATSADVATIKAALTLIESPEMAKMQVYSAEQSERSKFVQAGTGNALSRRLQELFDRRMAEEQDALTFSNPMRPSVRYN